MRMMRETFMSNTTLTYLSMNYCNIGAEGAISLAQGLMKNNKLLTLLLSNNDIGDGGMRAFGEALSNYQFNVEHLDLSYNNITDKGALMFAKFFGFN